jgi:Icc-related predicted phosphoesterase
MKILFFGDIHESIDTLKKVEGDFDTLLITGDLTQDGGAKDALGVLEEIRVFFPDFYAVCGNMDRPEVNGLLSELDINIHGKGVFLNKNIGVFGCGASAPTPFNTPNEISEDEIYSALEAGYDDIKNASLKIMVCHTPPIDTVCDRLPDGKHAGSKKVREFIEKFQPDFCLTGHIHEGIGSDLIGKTRIVNPGPFRKGHYGVLKTDEHEIKMF